MGLADAFSEITADKKERKSAEKRYVAFTTAEWQAMEGKYGKKIDPADVKKLVQGIFEGRFTIGVVKK